MLRGNRVGVVVRRAALACQPTRASSTTLYSATVRGTTAQQSASARRSCLVMHGIMGSGKNWRTFAASLADRLPHFEFVLADLRNHGNSQGLPGPHTVEQCAKDIAALQATQPAPFDVVCGHSFGGKVALKFVQQGVEGAVAVSRLPEQVWLLDSAPGAHPAFSRQVRRIIDFLHANQGPFPSRKALSTAMHEAGFSTALANWMNMNLTPRNTPSGGDFVWRFDSSHIDEMYQSHVSEHLWPVVHARHVPVHIVRGERSDVWSQDQLAELERAKAEGSAVVHTMDAGHWLHAEKPDELANILVAHLSKL